MPEAYLRAAKILQLAPAECLMVACHPFDLDAAANVGFRTALVRRPTEWGGDLSERPTMPPCRTYDIEVNSVEEILERLA